MLRYWCLLFSVAVLFLCCCLVFVCGFRHGTDCVCGADCGLGLTLGQNLSVIVKKNNSALLSCRQACSPPDARPGRMDLAVLAVLCKAAAAQSLTA